MPLITILLLSHTFAEIPYCITFFHFFSTILFWNSNYSHWSKIVPNYELKQKNQGVDSELIVMVLTIEPPKLLSYRDRI